MAAPLLRRGGRSDQHRDERLQPLAADPIRRLPQHDQRLADSIVIEPPLRPRLRSIGPDPAAKKPRSMLAMIARHRHELRHNPTLVRTARPTVSRRQRTQNFIPRRHAQPPHPCASCSRKCPATFLTRQRRNLQEQFRRGNAPVNKVDALHSRLLFSIPNTYLGLNRRCG